MKAHTAVRRRFIEDAAEFTPYVAVESRGETFLVPTDDHRLGSFFATQKRPEQKVLVHALTILERAGIDAPRDIFIDGGANIGTTAIAALRAGFPSVLAFEPDPLNARLLRANIALNGVHDSVRVFEAALSSRAGTELLELGRNRSMSRLLRVAPGPEAVTVEVPTLRLDDLVERGELDPTRVALLWLDVEGHECDVLNGAAAVLDRAPPLVMELYPELLRAAGMLDQLPNQLSEPYTHVADLRSTGELLPVDVVPELIERYDESNTDVLLCRP